MEKEIVNFYVRNVGWYTTSWKCSCFSLMYILPFVLCSDKTLHKMAVGDYKCSFSEWHVSKNQPVKHNKHNYIIAILDC